MSETMLGVFGFMVLMVGAFAASRVLARFTAAKFSRAMAPLATVIGGTFSTESLSNGHLEGSYGGREVQVTATPNVASAGTTDNAQRYSAFEVALLGVPGDRDWAIQFGSYTNGQIFSRDESWRFIGDDDLNEHLRSTPLVAELEAFAGAGVRGFPTLRCQRPRENPHPPRQRLPWNRSPARPLPQAARPRPAPGPDRRADELGHRGTGAVGALASTQSNAPSP